MTAAISMIAEHGNTCQAACEYPSYAGISAPTLNAQPSVSAIRDPSIRRGLYKTRAPPKAGNTRCPMAKTIVEMKPTVNACLAAPQIPPLWSAQAAKHPQSGRDQEPCIGSANEKRKAWMDTGCFGRTK